VREMCVTNIKTAKCRLWNANYVSPFTLVRKWERGVVTGTGMGIRELIKGSKG
jgi:hypothetical protein